MFTHLIRSIVHVLFRIINFISTLSLSLSFTHYICFSPFICRILYDKRFGAFHYPVSDEDAPNYRSIIQNPMDMATLLQRVDSGQYITCSTFLQDVDLIVSNAKVCSLLWLLHVTNSWIIS